MSLEKFTEGAEFDQDDVLLRHNAAIRDNWQAVSAVKQAIEAEDYVFLAEIWLNLADDVKDSLWLAPTKGGIFTTKEREVLKSNEAFNGRTQYQAENM